MSQHAYKAVSKDWESYWQGSPDQQTLDSRVGGWGTASGATPLKAQFHLPFLRYLQVGTRLSLMPPSLC